jgi:hypothetical protein
LGFTEIVPLHAVQGAGCLRFLVFRAALFHRQSLRWRERQDTDRKGASRKGRAEEMLRHDD